MTAESRDGKPVNGAAATESADKEAEGREQHDHYEHHEDLGIAGAMAKAFIQSPLSPMLLISCFAMGLIALIVTPRQEDPQISVPMVDIFFQYPGASPEQVSSLATDPLERMMSEIQGVKHTYSMSRRGGGMVTVQFEVGEQMEPSLVKLYDKLASNMDKMPPGVPDPLVKPKGVDDVPVVTLTLWSEDMDVGEGALRMLALDVMQRLKEVKNTSQTFVVGGQPVEVKVEVKPERLAGFGVSLDQIAQAIQSANNQSRVGDVEYGDHNFTFYSGSFLSRADEIERLMVGTRQGAPIYVRDLATVSESVADPKSMVRYYTGPAYDQKHGGKMGARAPLGQAAVTIAISKKKGSNGVTVAEDILKFIDGLKGQLIPDNIEVSVTRNYGKTADAKVKDLLSKLVMATVFVVALIFFPLGWRASIVVMLVIPVVILLTVFSAWVMNFTIDRVSLFALIFSIGILVDDAIVVVENVYRRWLEDSVIDIEVAVDAVREVGNPTILATFTVVAALLPMGFVSGMMGPYMQPIPALGSVAMIVSLLAAFIFTPWLAYLLRPSLRGLQKMQDAEHRQVEWLDGIYRRILPPLLDNTVTGFLFGLALIVLFMAALSMFYTTHVTVKMLPYDNKPEFNVVVNMPDGTALPRTQNVLQNLAEEILKDRDVTAVQTYSGTASPFNFNGMVRHYYLRNEPWYGDIQVELLDKKKRERSSHAMAEEMRDVLTPIARSLGARIQVVEMPPGPPVLQTMVAEIYGPDAQTRRQLAHDLTGVFERAKTVVDVENLMQDPHRVLEFKVDREKAVRRGVSVKDINRNLMMALGGFKVGDVKVGRYKEPRYIVLQVPYALRSQLPRIQQLPIPSKSGQMVPLAELGEFVERIQELPIYHKDLRPVEFVTGEVAGRLAAPIYGMLEIEGLLEKENYRAPDGVKLVPHYMQPPDSTSLNSAFEWTGEWTITYETFRDMGIAFAAALLLIYLLVVWEFGNFLLPAIIMSPIPLTLLGIVPGHWFMNAEFTATSMIGFIALAGIIVRNSILLVDFSKHAVEAGVPLREAVIGSCRTRTRPILLTAFTMWLGSSGILFDPIFEGMAISLIFGGVVATVLTLVVIPLGCVTWSSGLTQGLREREAREKYLAAKAAGHPEWVEQEAEKIQKERKPSAIGSFFSILFGIFRWILFLLQLLLMAAFNAILSPFRRKSAPPPAPSSPPPSSAPPASGGSSGSTTSSSSSSASPPPADDGGAEKGESEDAAPEPVREEQAPERAASAAREERAEEAEEESFEEVRAEEEPAEETQAEETQAEETVATPEPEPASAPSLEKAPETPPARRTTRRRTSAAQEGTSPEKAEGNEGNTAGGGTGVGEAGGEKDKAKATATRTRTTRRRSRRVEENGDDTEKPKGSATKKGSRRGIRLRSDGEAEED